MKKPKGKIDWRVAEDEDSWQAIRGELSLAEPAGDEAAAKAMSRRELALTALGLVLLLCCVAGWLWPRHGVAGQKSHQQQSIASEEEQTLTATLELLDESMQVNQIQHLDSRVMAQVTVNYPEEEGRRAYRELRFFEKSGGKWQRIRPDAALIGPEKTLSIAHFTLRFPAMDADAVYKTAPRLEELYAKLTGDFGLPKVGVTSFYSVELVTNGMDTVYSRFTPRRVILAASPALLSAPVEMTADDLLYQSLVYPFARQVVGEAMERHSDTWKKSFARWRLAPQALALWELWEDRGRLATGRVEVVRWLYTNAQDGGAQDREKRQPVPEKYAQLCRNYHIWRLLPFDVAIPLTCTEADQQPQTVSHYPTLPMSIAAQLYPKHGTGTLDGAFDAIGTGETLIEYVVATYGREKLPAFVTALGQQESLDGVVRGLFGVSPAEFGAGWRAYIEEHYLMK